MTGNRLRILLIDDDSINNFLSKELINMYLPGAEVSSILDAEEALLFLDEHKTDAEKLPEIILIDINMPVMDGWDFIEKFEQIDHPAFKNIRIFIYTSSVYFGDIERAKSYKSVVNIYSKPLTQDMLHEIANAQ
jgi:CheY-like chemotaxis protein